MGDINEWVRQRSSDKQVWTPAEKDIGEGRRGICTEIGMSAVNSQSTKRGEKIMTDISFVRQTMKGSMNIFFIRGLDGGLSYLTWSRTKNMGQQVRGIRVTIG